jgi:hypothetical protein
MNNNEKVSFVFMDESGNKESDRFFACGFLEVDDPKDFSSKTRRVYDQIFNLSVRNRQARIEKIFSEKKFEELVSLSKSFNQFELKHYHISDENKILYSDLIKLLFKKLKFKITIIVFDRQNPNYIRYENPHALHLRCLKLYANHCAPKNNHYIFVPDSFDDNFEWNVSKGHMPFGILPLDSKGAIYLQVTDILTGLVLQSLRSFYKELQNKSEKSRIEVLQTLENLLNTKITGNLTKIINNCYFSI